MFALGEIEECDGRRNSAIDFEARHHHHRLKLRQRFCLVTIGRCEVTGLFKPEPPRPSGCNLSLEIP